MLTLANLMEFPIRWFGALTGILMRTVLDPRQWILVAIVFALFGVWGLGGILVVDIGLAALWAASNMDPKGPA